MTPNSDLFMLSLVVFTMYIFSEFFLHKNEKSFIKTILFISTILVWCYIIFGFDNSEAFEQTSNIDKIDTNEYNGG